MSWDGVFVGFSCLACLVREFNVTMLWLPLLWKASKQSAGWHCLLTDENIFFIVGASVGHLVSVQGGRYDVNIRQRMQTAIYWQEEASPVRRCSWFYRPDGENRFTPYEEEFTAELEVVRINK